jgi:ribose transport system substrate-binding protein
MKKIFTIAAAVILLIMAFLIPYSIYYFQNRGLTYLEGNGISKENTKKPEYHFIVIAQNTDDSFWQSVKKGCEEASREFNVAVEFNGPRFTNIDEEIQYLNIAIASRVDGIVTHVLDESRFTPLINKSVEANIPVVTIEADAKNSKRKSYIGTNTYNQGSEAGKLVLLSTGNRANVAIILNSYIDSGENVSQNLRVAGFKDALKDAPLVKISTIKTSSIGFFSAEEVTKSILNDYPNVDTILCTSAKDTISVAQMIVDLNKVGQIAIIGSDDMPEILRYIEKGVIFGTVVGNPVKTGYESIHSLIEIKKDKMTSSYVDTGVKVVTSWNLTEYKNSVSSTGEKGNTK